MSKGLIPLMLSSPDATSSFHSSRSSVTAMKSPVRFSFSPAPPLSPGLHKRNQSDTPIIKLSRPPVRSSMKRQSQQLPASLPQIPYSSAEWKRAISEIKRYHVTRRYRACSARCNEILTNIKNIAAVEPAYLIYLNFYAASSLEMCARPLAPGSAYRLSLLQQARAHYDRAAALIRAAEDDALAMLLLQQRASRAASSLSSLHSPAGSVSSSSRTSSSSWTNPESDGVSTPTTCTLSRKSSLNVGGTKTPTTAGGGAVMARSAKKKVSFDLSAAHRGGSNAESNDGEINDAQHSTARNSHRWSFFAEPAIRPDSPTLGFDDEYFAAGAMRTELPELPTIKRRQQDSLVDAFPPPPHDALHMPSISERDEANAAIASSSPTTASSSDSGEESLLSSCSSTSGCGREEYHPYFTFPAARNRSSSAQSAPQEAAHAAAEAEDRAARARYAETLAALKVQVSRHTAALDEVLARDLQGAGEEDADGDIILHDGVVGSLGDGVRRMSLAQQGSGGSVVRKGSVSLSLRRGSVLGDVGEEESEEKLARDRKARIDRLKLSGWRRKRFDASRYEDLCDVVMAELNHA